MTTLVAGATGATGSLLVKQLLEQGETVRAIVRSADRLPESAKANPNFSFIEASLLDLTDGELQEQVNGCDAIASCLGHRLTPKGIYGKPKKLVTDATRHLCEAIAANNADKPVKFVLMNTTGNANGDLEEPEPAANKVVNKLLRLLLPPHPDNEQAAEYLRTQIDRDSGKIEWVAVRPDGLKNADEVSEYEIHPSPTRNPIFKPGKTNRINVANFMARLVTQDDLWKEWRWRMPVIYNQGSS